MAIIVKFTPSQLGGARAHSAVARDNPEVADRYGLDSDQLAALADKLAAAQPGFVELTREEAALLVGEFNAELAEAVAADKPAEVITSLRNIIAKIEAAAA